MSVLVPGELASLCDVSSSRFLHSSPRRGCGGARCADTSDGLSGATPRSSHLQELDASCSGSTWRHGSAVTPRTLGRAGGSCSGSVCAGEPRYETPGLGVTEDRSGPVCEPEETPWRRNLKMPPGPDGKRRIVNFMNWPNCCRFPPPSPPSWIKRPSSGWPPATWRWG